MLASHLRFATKKDLSISLSRKISAIHSISNKALSHKPFLIKYFNQLFNQPFNQRHELILLKEGN